MYVVPLESKSHSFLENCMSALVLSAQISGKVRYVAYKKLTLSLDTLRTAFAIDEALLIQTNNVGGSIKTEVTDVTVMGSFFPFTQADKIKTG